MMLQVKHFIFGAILACYLMFYPMVYLMSAEQRERHALDKPGNLTQAFVVSPIAFVIIGINEVSYQTLKHAN